MSEKERSNFRHRLDQAMRKFRRSQQDGSIGRLQTATTPSTKRNPGDRGLSLGGVAVTIALFLLPKTPPVIVGCLILIALLFLRPVWDLAIIKGSLLSRCTAITALCASLVYFGYSIWPRLVTFPKTVRFTEFGDRYVFRMENSTEFDAYMATVLLRATGADASGVTSQQHFTFSFLGPHRGLEPVWPTVEDSYAMICLDSDNRLAIQVSVHRMIPHEIREFSLKYSGKSWAIIHVDGTRFTKEPAQSFARTSGQEQEIGFQFIPMTSIHSCIIISGELIRPQ